MAGDWIKLEHATATKPEICLAAELLGISRREAIGLAIDYWIWLDANMDDSRNGVVTQTSRKSIENVLHCPGFACVLERIGWAKFDDDACTLTVSNWHRHNGKSAKTRALGKDRAAHYRNESITQHALPEKRREENKTIVGFDAFWKAWPSNPRKVAKGACETKWATKKLDALWADVVAHVEAMKLTTQWRDYCPSPLVYLNQERWRDPLPVDGPRKVAM